MKYKPILEKSYKIVLISNSSWYLYNFRYSLLVLLRKKGFSIELIAPFDSYTKVLQEEGFKVNIANIILILLIFL